MIDLERALLDTARAFERRRVPYMLIGGVANLFLGEARATRDIDFSVDIHPMGIEAFVDLAREIGEPLIPNAIEFVESRRFLPVRSPSGVRIDLLVATLAYEVDAIARAKRVEVGRESVSVCRAEDLIVMKIASERPRDSEDAAGVLRRQASSLDLSELDEMIAGLAREAGDPAISERYRSAKRSAGLED